MILPIRSLTLQENVVSHNTAVVTEKHNELWIRWFDNDSNPEISSIYAFSKDVCVPLSPFSFDFLVYPYCDISYDLHIAIVTPDICLVYTCWKVSHSMLCFLPCDMTSSLVNDSVITSIDFPYLFVLRTPF